MKIKLHKYKKNIIIIFFIIILSLIAMIRIIYLNTQKYPLLPAQNYTLQDEINNDGFLICFNNYQIYNANQLKEYYYDESSSSFMDESDIIFNVSIKNTTSEDKKINLEKFTMQNGYITGGGINPFLFNCLNTDLQSLTLEPNEEIKVLLPYPYLSDKDIKLILSLYPQKISVNIN